MIQNFSYSLIIPTRNRQHTAIQAVASALACPYPYLQVVVTDNSDDDRLRSELVRQGWLERVTYHKTERVLSMRDNWEQGLDLATGEYVAVIGDDDAILPDAPLMANITFSRDPEIEVLHSQSQALYKWPDYPFPGRQNYLRIRLASGTSIIDQPQEMLKKALTYSEHLGTGPGLYYGFVQRGFLERIKKIRGRWLIESNPDFDSGYATLMYAQKYAVDAHPMFISGHCGASNSGAMRYATRHEVSARVFAQENQCQSDSLYLDAQPSLRNISAAIVACQFRMLDEMRAALDDPDLEIDRLGAWNYIAQGTTQGYENVSFAQALHGLKELAKRWNICDQVTLPEQRQMALGLSWEQGFRDGRMKSETAPSSLVINGNHLGFTGIMDAVRYINAIHASPAHRSDDAEVRQYFGQWLERQLEPLLIEARQHLALGHEEEAEAGLLRYLREDTHHGEALRLLGELYLRQQRYGEAAMMLARALSLSTRIATLRAYATACLALDMPQQILFMVERALEQNPEHAEIVQLAQEIRAAAQD